MSGPDDRLSPDDLALLDLARDAHDPSDGDRARVRSALASRLGITAGLGVAAGVGAAGKAAAATSAGATGAGLLGAGAAVKVIGAVVVVSAAVGVGTKVVHHAHRSRVAAVARVEKRLPPAPQRSAAVRPDVTPPVPPLPEPVAPLPLDPPAAASKPAARVHWTTPETSAPRRPTPALADEAGLLHAAVLARRSGQPARALKLFDRHALLYPHGVLAEERDAERALALVDLGRTAEARAAIEDFLRAHPASPLGARLREWQHQLNAKP